MTKETKIETIQTGPGDMIEPVGGAIAPISQADRLIELAITNKADPAHLDRLLDLKERYDREEARKAYTHAMAAFKAEGLEIYKDREVDFPHKDGSGGTNYWHATLGNIVDKAVPIMARHGLSHVWDINQDGSGITVSCVVSHEAGHHGNPHTLSAGPDTSGKKNPIQQVASTITYLERYTFLAATGLAVKDAMADDDGGTLAEEIEVISEEQGHQLHALITENGLNMEVFLNWLSTSMAGVTDIAHIPAARFAEVKAQVDKSIVKAKKATK